MSLLPLKPAAKHRSAHQSARRLAWGLALSHPLAPLFLLVLLIALAVVAIPILGPKLRPLLPVRVLPAPRPLPSPGPVVPAVAASTPTANPAIPTALPASPGVGRAPRTASAATPTPAPFSVPCHVVRSGRVEDGTGERWTVEIAVDENITDRAGRIVLPAGIPGQGTVRLGRSGEPSDRPSLWRLHLPEAGGGQRELELTASYEARAGGIAQGAVGRLVVRTVNRIGERRDDDPMPDDPRPGDPTLFGPDADLPRH